MTGRAVFFGPFFDATTSVGSDGARSRPSAFTAVTRTRRVRPTSPTTGGYVSFEAPAIPLQAVPSDAHRCHAYAYDVGLFAQVPREAVSAAPSRAAPEIVGRAVFSGAAAAAVPVTVNVRTASPATRNRLRVIEPLSLLKGVVCPIPASPIPKTRRSNETLTS